MAIVALKLTVGELVHRLHPLSCALGWVTIDLVGGMMEIYLLPPSSQNGGSTTVLSVPLRGHARS